MARISLFFKSTNQQVKDLALYCCGSDYCCGSGLMPALGTSACWGCGQKKKKKAGLRQVLLLIIVPQEMLAALLPVDRYNWVPLAAAHAIHANGQEPEGDSWPPGQLGNTAWLCDASDTHTVAGRGLFGNWPTSPDSTCGLWRDGFKVRLNPDNGGPLY